MCPFFQIWMTVPRRKTALGLVLTLGAAPAFAQDAGEGEAQAAAVGGLEHLEGGRLVLDLLGEVPEEERGHHRVGVVEEIVDVLVDPAGDAEGGGLRGSHHGHG